MAYALITLTDLLTALGYRLGANTTYWSTAEKTNAINEALCVWQAATGEVTRTDVVSVTNDTVFYTGIDLTAWASISRITFLGVPLVETSLEELDLGIPNWVAAASTTPLYWAPVGQNGFAIYPPTTTSIGTTFTISGPAEAQALASGGEYIQLGSEVMEVIVSYAHHYLLFKEGGAEFQATQQDYEKFVEAAGLRNAQFIASSTYRRLTGQDKNESLREPKAPIKTLGIRA